MSPLLKKTRKLSSFTNNNDQSSSSSPWLSSLPDEIVLQCLLYLPRSYDLNLSCVSKTLRSLVRSPELHRLRSSLPKDSIYVSFRENDAPGTTDQYWFTLHPIQKTKTMIEHRLIPITFPSHPFMYHSETVAVGSEIFFVGGSSKPSSDLWILDTRSRKLTQGPSMKVARTCDSVVGVINGKIYVIGGCENKNKIQVEVFDPKTRDWKVAESPEERFQRRLIKQISAASLDWKVYSADIGRINVYNARQGRRRFETLEMPTDVVWCMCVVADLLYACFFNNGLMWFDAKRKIWSRVGGVDVKTLDVKCHEAVMTEYNGKLAVLWPDIDPFRMETQMPYDCRCALIVLDWNKDGIRGRMDWSGTVATMPYDCRFNSCLVVSD